MSSSRQSDSGNDQNDRPPSRSNRDDTPPWPRLPPMRALPPLRGIATPRDHEDGSPPLTATQASSRSTGHQRVPYMSTNAAIRAERIRNLQNLGDRSQRVTQDLSAYTSGWSSVFQRANEDLGEANSRLRALLDLTSNPLGAAQSNTQDPVTDEPSSMRASFSPYALRPNELPDDSNRRNKRRKLDEKQAFHSRRFRRYGKYGQVEPGQLQLEIVSCDGGMFSNRPAYSSDNILRDDNSVYCTKGNRCNIILRHQGSTVFTLRELVIKAPASMNFSHPVREGMVFITMERDETFTRTARYQVQYCHDPTLHPSSSCPYAIENMHNEDDDLPFTQAFNRELHRVITIRRRRRADDGSLSGVYSAHLDDDDNDEDDFDMDPSSTTGHADHLPNRRFRNNTHSSHRNTSGRRHPSMPSEFFSNHPDIQITTECSDDEDDIAGIGLFSSSNTRRARPAPNRIGSLPFETADSDPENDGDGSLLLNTSTNNPDSSNSLPYSTDHHHHYHHPPSDSLVQAWEAHARATQEAVRAVGGAKLLVPHARFFIEKHKSKCTIRFDPPVSGRFILLKMWSSHHEPGGNIDIQSVIARGFAGPRYFPCVELR